MTTKTLIERFLAHPHLALAGASPGGKKFGNQVLKALRDRDYRLSVLHPEAERVDGVACYPSPAELPPDVGGLYIAVAPERATALVRAAAAAGIRDLWLQKGAESEAIIAECHDQEINLVHGECLLMFARPRGIHRLHHWLRDLSGTLPG